MKQYTITINEKEKDLLIKVLGIGIYNGNHIEPKAYKPNGKEYKILCPLFNKVCLSKKGKWEIANDSIYENMVDLKCSICGYTDIFESERTVYNYCPECGAKMSCGQNENEKRNDVKL